METNKEQWLKEDRTIYCLHETGEYNKGERELCNKYYFSIQPDYARGITAEMAAEKAEFIQKALNNYDYLVGALERLYNFSCGKRDYLDQCLNDAEYALKRAE